MDTFKQIEFHRTRDFSAKMNITFEFIKQNFKPLAKSLLVIAGPPMLIAALLMGSSFSDFFTFSSMVQNPAIFDKFTSPSFWLQLGFMLLMFLLAGACCVATINNYLLIYDEKKSNQIEVQEVWERVRKALPMNIGTMILYLILAIVSYFLFAIPMFLLAAISPWLIFFGVIILVWGITYAFVGASFVFIIRTYEHTGFFDALIRSFRIIQGKWWSTFGLMFVLTLIGMAISWVVIMPWYAVTMTNNLHSISTGEYSEPSETYQIVTMIVLSVYYLIQILLYSLPTVGLAFQYFNLVERRESRGLMTQISTLGEQPAGPGQEEQY